jgi:hypothetical protein
MLVEEHPKCLHFHFLRFTISASQRLLTADVRRKYVPPATAHFESHADRQGIFREGQSTVQYMNPTRRLAAVFFYAVALHASSALATHSGLSGFSSDFLRDYDSAQKAVDQSRSAEPLVALLARYTNEAEKAELEVSIGLAYGQRTGVVDPAKAVAHFTTALQYQLPEKTYMEVLMWRGNAQEQIKKPNEALMDYLRGLLACSYHDLSRGWPEIQSPKVPIYMNSLDPENGERVRDYNTYRKFIDFQRFLLMQRFFLIEAVKRVQPEVSKSDDQIVDILATLSPDSSRFGTITDWLKSENVQPWP